MKQNKTALSLPKAYHNALFFQQWIMNIFKHTENRKFYSKDLTFNFLIFSIIFSAPL